MTYREARIKVAELLSDAGVMDAQTESGLLLEAVIRADRSFYLMHQMEEIPDEVLLEYLTLTQKRCTRKPLQYLLGEQYFMGLPFSVDEHVLIPRQDTECLVEQALKMIHEGSVHTILDLCTGSGCIAVSLAHFCADVSVSGADISKDALQIAAKNGQKNETDIEWLESDLFSKIHKKYDMIISNPPYIPTQVIEGLMPEVKDYEPRLALDGKADGLYFYRKIIEECRDYLNPDGYLLFEIGCEQASAVSELMRNNGFDDINVIRDLAGLDRVVTGRR